MTLATKLKNKFSQQFSDRPNILSDIILILEEVILDDEFPVVKYVTAKDLLKNMSVAFGIPIVRAVDRKRARTQVAFRQYFCYECKRVFKSRYSLKDIGYLLGGYDHTTIIHNIQTCRNRLEAKDEIVLDLQDKWVKYNS